MPRPIAVGHVRVNYLPPSGRMELPAVRTSLYPDGTANLTVLYERPGGGEPRKAQERRVPRGDRNTPRSWWE